MRNRFALGFLALAVWLCSSTAAWAVALGKIDVASYLGERFFAEVPLQLEHGEKLANVSVSLASPADYRVLEIYRDPALNAIQAEIKNDKRGPRVVLSSQSGVNTPFFNLVLKVRYERATHFKKFPVFLDIPKVAQPAKVKPLPTVKQGAAPKPAPAKVAAKPAAPKPGSSFTPYDGWARIGRYGPLVHGNNVSTVAQRLRVNNRFTMNQVIVAIFEKNRGKFLHDNVNLVPAGVYLQVPKAAEVERISPAEASSIMAKQDKAWRELTKQPRFSAASQQHRFSKRVRMGEKAVGVSTAAVAAKAKPAPVVQAKSEPQATSAVQQQLQKLQQENAALQDKLNATQKQLANASASPDAAAAAAAADAKIKKLQIQLARLQAERGLAQRQAKSQSPLGWLTYTLIAVVILLLAIVGMLMRRERAHPAAAYAMPEPEPDHHDFDHEPEHGSYAPAEHARESEEEVEEEDSFEFASALEPEEEVFQHTVVEEPEEEAFPHAEAPEPEEQTLPHAEALEPEEIDSIGIPDLTEEDTGRMEAFQPAAADQADPNVDYLAEADVYLRYGMDDEAIQQVRMALQLDAGNADAHIKMVQLLRAKDDRPSLDEAMAAARQALQGDALSRFEESVGEGGEPVVPEPAQPDTQVPGAGVAEDLETPAAEAEPSGGAFDLSDIEIPEPEAEAAGADAEDDTGDMEKTVAITRPKEMLDTAEGAAMFEEETPASEDASEPETKPEDEGIDAGLDLGDIDFDQVDLDQADAPTSDDEFSSTIRKNLSETDAGEDEAVPELDLTSELEIGSGGDDKAEPEKAGEDKGELELGDVDAVHDELNNLLDELADEAEKEDGDGKKKS